eukprot:Cvel_7019.t1-p1 / transcript=Cvel_7019.t1 / gene=Cvel_7019 / organism=Chromera_velia_CCMP2878 / gene_product=hypothetical protein / transcript_product=hypothetical protein / location=Cvel_scaffold357:93597-95283(+) / protein_length=402 / sequence_SO=supercontig / SO=protein_coding / is_pseudo=false
MNAQHQKSVAEMRQRFDRRHLQTSGETCDCSCCPLSGSGSCFSRGTATPNRGFSCSSVTCAFGASGGRCPMGYSPRASSRGGTSVPFPTTRPPRPRPSPTPAPPVTCDCYCCRGPSSGDCFRSGTATIRAGRSCTSTWGESACTFESSAGSCPTFYRSEARALGTGPPPVATTPQPDPPTTRTTQEPPTTTEPTTPEPTTTSSTTRATKISTASSSGPDPAAVFAGCLVPAGFLLVLGIVLLWLRVPAVDRHFERVSISLWRGCLAYEKGRHVRTDRRWNTATIWYTRDKLIVNVNKLELLGGLFHHGGRPHTAGVPMKRPETVPAAAGHGGPLPPSIFVSPPSGASPPQPLPTRRANTAAAAAGVSFNTSSAVTAADPGGASGPSSPGSLSVRLPPTPPPP